MGLNKTITGSTPDTPASSAKARIFDKLDLNKFAQQVHANAVKDGLWSDFRTPAGVLCLVHSEWSNAYTAGAQHKDKEAMNFLIDGVILLLDAAAAWGVTLPEDIFRNFEGVREIFENIELPNLVMVLHCDTDELWDSDITHEPQVHARDFANIIGDVYIWLGARGIDVDNVLQARAL